MSECVNDAGVHDIEESEPVWNSSYLLPVAPFLHAVLYGPGSKYDPTGMSDEVLRRRLMRAFLKKHIPAFNTRISDMDLQIEFIAFWASARHDEKHPAYRLVMFSFK